MKVIEIADYGSADNLVVAEREVPQPSPGEVRVRVAFGGLRWGDIMQRNGFPTRARPTPFVAGQEASGIVDQVGDDVTGVAVGDRVVVLTFGGAWAEYVVVPEAQVLPVPDGVGLDVVLAYPVNLLTAYYVVQVWGRVQPGERVLLHAAAGGVGLLALQIMKRRIDDVTVVAVVSSQEKADLVRANGADVVVDRTTTDYVEEIERTLGPKASGFMTGGERGGGVDVSLNGVSGPTLTTDPRVIRKRGRWVIYGWAAGRGRLDTSTFGYDGITVMPFSSIAWMGTPEHQAGIEFVREWLESEELVVPTVLPLEEVREAERALEAGATIGKVVLRVADLGQGA
ncbi:MAG: zinc-binding dehydrogenase [Actinobacteria bacterium]|nr:zinc-binding dehydrogenase [Actinomycetota bacterium]